MEVTKVEITKDRNCKIMRNDVVSMNTPICVNNCKMLLDF